MAGSSSVWQVRIRLAARHAIHQQKHRDGHNDSPAGRLVLDLPALPRGNNSSQQQSTVLRPACGKRLVGDRTVKTFSARSSIAPDLAGVLQPQATRSSTRSHRFHEPPFCSFPHTCLSSHLPKCLWTTLQRGTGVHRRSASRSEVLQSQHRFIIPPLSYARHRPARNAS